MILIDAGPLVALMDQADPYHKSCYAVSVKLPPGPIATTWPCFTEAMYFLGKSGGFDFQQRLWRMHTTGSLRLIDLTTDEILRVHSLMQQYRDRPLDLADASLIAIAERREMRQIFAIDSDFHIYRLADGSSLELIQ